MSLISSLCEDLPLVEHKRKSSCQQMIWTGLPTVISPLNTLWGSTWRCNHQNAFSILFQGGTQSFLYVASPHVAIMSFCGWPSNALVPHPELLPFFISVKKSDRLMHLIFMQISKKKGKLVFPATILSTSLATCIWLPARGLKFWLWIELQKFIQMKLNTTYFNLKSICRDVFVFIVYIEYACHAVSWYSCLVFHYISICLHFVVAPCVKWLDFKLKNDRAKVTVTAPIKVVYLCKQLLRVDHYQPQPQPTQWMPIETVVFCSQNFTEKQYTWRHINTNSAA